MKTDKDLCGINLLPLPIKTGYELEFTSEFNFADLRDGEHVRVRTKDGATYDRCFNRAEFKQRGLEVVGVMTSYRYQWKRPASKLEGVTA
jgi:hypothetical protein